MRNVLEQGSNLAASLVILIAFLPAFRRDPRHRDWHDRRTQNALNWLAVTMPTLLTLRDDLT
jgi:hypothetical protein